ncbi:MAG: phenylacetate--CoA ligase family protein [Bacteroidales bacterium]|nr:phenylacetate--CoA ligase family protein [Bacteroidales bacterium]
MAFLHEHIILPLSDLLKGEQVHKYLKILKEAERWTPEQMSDFQQQKLRQLLEYAAKEVSFYRDWFLDHNNDPQTATLEQLPIVSKAIMREEGIDRFSAEHFPVKRRIHSRSSGSTGEPFSVYETKLSSSVNTAAKLRTWYMAGYRLGDRYMKIANGARHGMFKKLQDKINNCLYVPFYSMSDDVLRSILDKIEHSRPSIIRSYPIPLYLLAQYRNNHNDDYHHKPLHVMTTGSTLPAAFRTEIEKAFGCDVIDSYSCEGTANCYETPEHDGYHITQYYGIIEILDDNNHPITNGIGHVVSTDLWNLAHPFIRYDTQDLVEVHNGKITRIMGRECETLVHANGEIFTVHNFSHFFLYELSSVLSYQIVKHKDGGITFRLVVNEQYTSGIERYIINFWEQQLDVPISVSIVDEIPLMHNNKRLTIVEEK